MADQESKIFRKTEIVGTSSVGFDDAVQRAVERARKTLRNVMWFEITEQRGRITESGDIEYQITLEIGFQLEEPDH
jgi:dodecin